MNAEARTPQGGSVNKHISRYDFTAVYTHPDAKADIVLVHGLNGDPQRTWTAKNGVFWPADLLPVSLRSEHANVLVYGYNADVYSSRNDRSASDNFIHHHAQTLVTSLTHYRKSEDSMRKPIIWVAHSLGGILTKRALLYSNDLRNDHHHEDYRSVFVSTYAIIFLGTPHTGSDMATWGHVLQSMSDAVVPKKFFETEPVLLRTLKKDNETLQNINNHFLDVYQRFMIHMAHENHKTDIKGTKVMVVDSASASPQLPGVTYYGIEATHSGMCKFESANAPGYRIVSTAIREWVAEAGPVIQVRWLVELDERNIRARLEFSERRIRQLASPTGEVSEEIAIFQDKPVSPLSEEAPEATSPMPTPLLIEGSHPDSLQSRTKDEPLFIHPESFRPNSYFVGREEELKHLHRMLMNRKRRSEGTSAVLIQCLPGGGKTHLARQYVFQYRGHYPGGVYWVRAKSQQEMEYWYWRIAKNEALKGLVTHEDLQELRNPKKIVAIVRKWLNSFDNWLLVLDGIHFDIPGLHEFIPDAKNTSLIFTSTERAVTGDHHFDNPQVMELGLLSAKEAQELLLLEMDKRKPWTQDDLSRAHELVLLMDRLPLMIHVAAQHLKATREPLSKYLRSYKNRPKAGALPAYKAVRDQLQNRGATAALNLMSILVFFDQHIPVEMFALGMSALDSRTPVRTTDPLRGKANLGTTLAVLIAFALVERSESDDMSPNSSRSSRKSFDKNVDFLDLLRIHSVVQAFFIETLTETKEVHFWLERAAAVWCHSFDQADRRIKEDAKVGLPDDYRRYSIHGRKLLEHLDRFEKKSPDSLSRSRAQIEQRLSKIGNEIDQLSHTVQSHIVDGSGEVPPASVFERTSSASETDSTLPSQQSSSELEPVLQGNDEDNLQGLSQPQQVESPVAYSPDYVHNPYQFHVPYPQHQTMPYSPDPDYDDDDRTVLARSDIIQDRGVSKVVAQPSGSGFSGSGSPYPPSSAAFSDWELEFSNHRSVRKIESRRYHDRAGAWRDSTVSDPRVSISREIAKGSISGIGNDRSGSTKTAGRSPSRATKLSAGSRAELQLHKIRTATSPSPRSSAPAIAAARVAGEGEAERSSSIGGGNLRQRFSIGTNSYADPKATETPENSYSRSPAELSANLARVASSPSVWTSATIKRLRENLKPSSGSPSGQSVVARMEAADDGDRPQSSNSSLFLGSRHSNRNVSLSGPLPMPREDLGGTQIMPGPSRHSLPLPVRHWETHTYHPSLYRLESSGIADQESPDPLSFSYPFVHRDAYRITIEPPPAQQQIWEPTPHDYPGGYSSQPMTRDPSHDSNKSQSGGSGSPPTHASHTAPSSGPARILPPLTAGPAQPGSELPRPQGSASSSGSRASRFLFPFSRRRQRPPSVTETEPSPRLGPVFPEVRTSYQSWEARQNSTGDHDRDRQNMTPITVQNLPPGRRRADSAGVVEGASARLPLYSSYGSPYPPYFDMYESDSPVPDPHRNPQPSPSPPASARSPRSSPGPATAPAALPLSSSSSPLPWRLRRGREGGRSQSQSPIAGRGGRRRRLSPPPPSTRAIPFSVYPPGSASAGSTRRSSPLASPPESPRLGPVHLGAAGRGSTKTAGSESRAGGDAMERSASAPGSSGTGGFMLADGRVIGFGDPTTSTFGQMPGSTGFHNPAVALDSPKQQVHKQGSRWLAPWRGRAIERMDHSPDDAGHAVPQEPPEDEETTPIERKEGQVFGLGIQNREN